MDRRMEVLGALSVSLLIAAAFQATAHVDGTFWWSDAPRHALNGIFLKDLGVELGFLEPYRYAIEYYLRYPALTILFYPPLLYALSIPFHLLFGDNHWVSQLVITSHIFFLAIGMYVLSREFTSIYASLSSIIFLVTMPEVLLWGRQVMLDLPAIAYLVWAAYFAVRHARTTSSFDLIAACLSGVAAIYVKLNMVYGAPALALYLLMYRGRSLFSTRALWLAAGLSALALVPLVAMTAHFGQINIQSVVGGPDAGPSRATLAGWTWYAAHLPGMAGPIALGLAGVGLAASVSNDRAGALRQHMALFGGWLVFCYATLSMIGLKETRHGLLLLVPIAAWAGIGAEAVSRLVASLFSTSASAERARLAGPAIATATGLAAFAAETLPRVDGYREAATIAAERALPDSTVLFSGYRDGSFIFNMRTISGRNDLIVFRADKLLLRVAVKRELGVEARDYTEEEIASLLRELGVSIVVAERDFWTDIAPMERLQRVLDGPLFEEIARVPIDANVPVEEREIRIFRARGDVRPRPARISVELPIIGRSVSGGIAPH